MIFNKYTYPRENIGVQCMSATLPSSHYSGKKKRNLITLPGLQPGTTESTGHHTDLDVTLQTTSNLNPVHINQSWDTVAGPYNQRTQHYDSLLNFKAILRTNLHITTPTTISLSD